VLHDAGRGVALVRAERAIAVAPGARGASQTHFGFGSDTWIAAQRAISAAGGLTLIGFAHSHPPCASCPSNPECRAHTVFFSADDREVQATAFPSPYMLALVVGKLGRRPATEPGFGLFGWSRGEMRPRSFHTLRSPPGAGALRSIPRRPG
jgi:hypothetical protein